MSSPFSYRPSLVRRLLPWIYLGIFCFMAPLLVFYTSGYRYNSKKGLIERNGTLIVDSTPKGSTIFLNDQDTGEKTPVTFQNMIPGWQRLRVTRPGYSPWEENILIRPERVSFAHQIWLWKESPPQYLSEEHILQMQADPLAEKAAFIENTGTTSTSIRFWSPEVGFSSSIRLTHASSSFHPLSLRWREDGQALLLSESEDEQAWWTTPHRPAREAHLLPRGSYHWSKNELIGNDGTSVLRLDPIRERVERRPLADHVVQESDDLEIRLASSTEQRILADRSLLTRLFLLPIGSWELAEIHRPSILLKDKRDHWLGVQLKYGQPDVEKISGDGPRWSPKSDVPTAAFLHGGELWIWEMGKEPRLVWRQGDPLVQAIWHRSGTSLFIADQKEVKALSISDPVQSVQSLASFDEIRDITVIERELYIAGKREEKDGLWKLSVE